MLSHSQLLELKRWNTPTIYNGWELLTEKDRLDILCNREEIKDFMPQMGPMVGYAVTLTFEPSNKKHFEDGMARWEEYLKYVSSVKGPKIVVLQDFDSPDRITGSFWGEVCSNIHKSLGCVGTITDGAIRDVDEMTNAGFKALARRLCVGHAYSVPVEWGNTVKVYGCEVNSGDLIHADKHGFMVIPEEDQRGLLEASLFMDSNECNTVIKAARASVGMSLDEVRKDINNAQKEFKDRAAAYKKQIKKG